MQLTDKYRPTDLSQIAGNEKAINILQSFLAKPFPSAWLLKGKSGIGKTSACKIIANTLTNDTMSILDRYQGEEIGIEQVKLITQDLRCLPLMGGYKVLIIDEADRMSKQAQNLFLDFLERIPSHVVVLFTSNESEAFEDRFLSRCKVIHFTTQGLLDPAALYLQAIAVHEGSEIDNKTAKKLIRNNGNNIRAAINSLELELMTELACVDMPVFTLAKGA